MDRALFQENERLTPNRDSRLFHDLGFFSYQNLSEPSFTSRIAYETWGKLNEAKDNAVLICHALSGDSHCIGWWSRIIGPGRALDPADWFVIGTNALGGCQGSTGPGTLDEEGRRLGTRFPEITLGDMARAQASLIDFLGIPKLALVCGGSMGGMQALEWAVSFPDRVERCWTTASCRAHSAMQIGFNETARQAVIRDPKWRGGDFPDDDPPRDGLAVARMVGHLSYLSEGAFQQKFGRGLQEGSSSQFQVESYLSYQGDKFTHRFDAGSLVTLTHAIDRFCLESLSPAACRFLFTSFTSDWLYPSHQSQELNAMAEAAGLSSRWQEIDLPYGHDAFLLDSERQADAVRGFLSS